MNEEQTEVLRLKYKARFAESTELTRKAEKKAEVLKNGTLIGDAKSVYILSINALRVSRLDVAMAMEVGEDEMRADAMLRILSGNKTTLASARKQVAGMESCVVKARRMLLDLGVVVRDVRRKDAAS